MAFEEDHGFSLEMQERFALDIYEQGWDGCEVIQNDKKAKDEEIAQLLDFGDVDKIIKPNTDETNIAVAQRFRRNRDPQPTDFTLRCFRKGREDGVEYQRLMDAYHRDDAIYPKRYAFGVGEDNPRDNGFRVFCVLETDVVIEAIQSGELTENGPIKNYDEYGNWDGTKFYVYPIHEVYEVGAPLWEWTPQEGIKYFDSNSSQQSRPSRPHKITSWGGDD